MATAGGDDPLRRYLERPGQRRLSKVVEAYHGYVWRLALKLTGNQEDAADITQDVFLGLLLRPPAPERVRSPRGYLAWRVVTRAGRL
ncbi:MAG: RNA polymerase sigma factor, partial [Thermoanaerobaculia bacterium]